MSPPAPPFQPPEQEIVRLYLTGHPGCTVAALLQVTPAQVYSTLRRLGVKRRSRGRVGGSTCDGKLTVQQREQLRADLRSGEFPTLRAIGCKYGVTHEAVRQNAAAIGVTRYTVKERAAAFREQSRRRREAADAAHAARQAGIEARRQRLARLWQSGMKTREIAALMGFASEGRVSRAIDRQRLRFPQDFPRRKAPKREPHVVAAARAACAARVAARKAEVERRRVLLAEFWRRRATGAEMAHTLGFSVNICRGMLGKYRQRFPADFPPRSIPPKRKGVSL